MDATVHFHRSNTNLFVVISILITMSAIFSCGWVYNVTEVKNGPSFVTYQGLSASATCPAVNDSGEATLIVLGIALACQCLQTVIYLLSSYTPARRMKEKSKLLLDCALVGFSILFLVVGLIIFAASNNRDYEQEGLGYGFYRVVAAVCVSVLAVAPSTYAYNQLDSDD